MEKELKDYAHLYLGCDCRWNDRIWKFYKYDQSNVEAHLESTDAYDDTVIVSVDQIKLLLRPLDNMLRTEAFYIFKIYFGKEMTEDWSGDTGSAYFQPAKVLPTREHAMRIINGQDYESGDFMKVVGLVPFLLKQEFDIFDLIGSGLAILRNT